MLFEISKALCTLSANRLPVGRSSTTMSASAPAARNSTIAHEFGHYLLHRERLPKGIECDERAVSRRDGQGIEKEADEFAAWLLMPLDDFRARIGPADKPSMDDLKAAAEHYGVSLMAAALRWLEYTDRRALFVVSRDGGALWARSSDAAFKTRRYIRTVSDTYMLPENSLAGAGEFDAEGRASGTHPPGVWFPDERGGDLRLRQTLRLDPYASPFAEPSRLDPVRRAGIAGHFRQVHGIAVVGKCSRPEAWLRRLPPRRATLSACLHELARTRPLRAIHMRPTRRRT